MNIQPILEVKNIGKAYKNYSSEIWRILSWFGVDLKPAHETWTLQDINFSIIPGEAVGIIGQNGAGKSTLLKIITGTLKPTMGSVHVRGKIAAILELGMGFYPDLTGRQNAYHSAGLMGYTQEQIDGVIADIESFADIGEYFEQPVRTYSSGMQARVAFAVATAFRPDILIVDEALSVGDMYFQQKSLYKIQQMQKLGTSLLFVSHSIGQIKSICQNTLYLKHGEQVAFGESETICTMYQNDTTKLSSKELLESIEKIQSVINQEDVTILQSTNDANVLFKIDPEFSKKITQRSGGGEVEFVAVDIYDKNNNLTESIEALSEITFVFSFITHADIPEGASFGFLIRDEMGNDLLACNSNYYDYFLSEIPHHTKAIIKFTLTLPMMAGNYSIQCGIKPHFSSSYYYDRPFNVKVFEIYNPSWLQEKFFGGRLFIKPKELVLSKIVLEDQNKFNSPFDFITKNHFKNNLTTKEQEELFKISIKMVEIENFSYCNRTCWFCPSSIIDRKSKNIFMSESLYIKVLKELQKINYSGTISFSRYNEPLADREILNRIKIAKKILPKALLHTNTNGDYLTLDYLEELYNAGLRSINIQSYLSSNIFSTEQARSLVIRQAEKLKIPIIFNVENHDWIEIKAKYKDMELRIYARNFLINGVTRGGTIDDIPVSHIRTSPCLSPFYHMYLDYNGNYMPCCNLRSDCLEHEAYNVGNANNISIIDAYVNLYSWRRSLCNFSKKRKPCDSCNFVEFDSTGVNIEKMKIIKDFMNEHH